MEPTKYSDTILRNLLLETCVVSKCQVHNCTIKRSRFSDSEVHQCVFVQMGENKKIEVTNINTFTDCKIYSCDSIRHAVIENSEVHDSTVSSGGWGVRHVAIRRSKLFSCRLPEHPMVSRSDLHDCVLFWISVLEGSGAGLANCNVYDSLLENPLVRDSKLRNCKVVGLSAIQPTTNSLDRSVVSNLFIECEIRRVAVSRGLFIESHLKYTSIRDSSFTRCSVRRCSIAPAPAKKADVVEALRSFPRKQEKGRPLKDEMEKSLTHLPLEIQMRVVQFAAASLQWNGISPPLIVALRPHPLLYRTALSAFAQTNWYSTEAIYAGGRRSLRKTPKSFHTVRKLEIQNLWVWKDCIRLIQRVPSLTSLELSIGHFVDHRPEKLPDIFNTVKRLKCLRKFSITECRLFPSSLLYYQSYAQTQITRRKLEAFVRAVDKEWKVQSSFKGMEDFWVLTWKAPPGCTLTSGSKETMLVEQKVWKLRSSGSLV
ncbi:hypothetical protein GLAREA_11437 [Glarea lozoyensis ATCC 20868]|uniref:Uncharacterized protein n=1 Tax=Glarea lozoyensis (strain ATCC 20868 / MF5171) TaxID=1116229 RepID=S3CYH0_GLAL2|nr:uncharacterized protein GLAREA_11437 [Glarea lozoyensis ATCC 20868]EPE24856.1 hypothetical protein GLAREA_11437 [Glarea lozoyensis ATCC 20868]